MPRPLSFTRAMRLVHRNDFARTFREGRRARGAVIVAVVATNGLEHTRLGLSVGRVIWKSAVQRNRVRRVFREAFRLSYPELPRGLDVILIPARPKLEPELAATRAELVSLVQRAAARVSETRTERGTASRAASGPRAPQGRPAPRTGSDSRSGRARRASGATGPIDSIDADPAAARAPRRADRHASSGERGRR